MRAEWQAVILEELPELFPHLSSQEHRNMKAGLADLFRQQREQEQTGRRIIVRI